MKFFAVLSAIVAVAVASPGAWTIHELSEVLQNPNTDPHLVPYLEQALNELMLAVVSGSPQTVTSVSSPVQDFSIWTLQELSDAIQDPATDPALLPSLEWGLNTLMGNLINGQQQETIIIATPVGLLPVEAVVPVPAPAPVETPVAPIESPVESAASPLVQIIVNVNSQEAIAPSPVALPSPAPVVLPAPAPVVLPAPVLPEVVPSPVVLPAPVLPVVVPSPVVLPAPVLPEVVLPNPVDIIAINPEASFNPVDVIAPVPVVAPVGAVDIVGPLV